MIARWSASELKTQLYIIEDDIEKTIFEKLLNEVVGIHKMLNGFIKTLQK